jgi:hypothetical protein
VSYAIGDFSVGLIDYAFPVDGASDGYFEIRNHIGEATLSYGGSDSLPVTAMLGVNIYNDDDNSVYAELGIPVKIGASELNLCIAGGNEMYTQDRDFALSNIGFSMAKEMKITETFSVNASASAIFNPDSDDAYLVFILSL